jgi:hypothetical protein
MHMPFLCYIHMYGPFGMGFQIPPWKQSWLFFFFFLKYCFVTKCQILEEKKYIYQGIIFDKPKFNKFKKSL